jgi:thioredoxin reductase (NADPH)
MNLNLSPLLVYLLPMAAVWLFYLRRQKRIHDDALGSLSEAEQSGLTEPASLHPVIDPTLCLGCGTCVTSCPEGEILGLVHGKAMLVQPANCIGHGACKEACPQDAIRLVLGTERRGVEVPVANEEFETQVPGLFVAGEVTGMGLIRNAIAQGTLAMESAANFAAKAGTNTTEDDRLDAVIVGMGPAGLAASLKAQELGLKFKTLEQETVGGTIAHYPRGKVVMTNPVELPGYGTVRVRETSKEALLDLWCDAIEKTGLQVSTGQRVKSIDQDAGGLIVETTKGVYPTRAVVLAIGRRGSPRRLGVPGEDLDKVVYRLVDPEQYAGLRVLVVGGGDSALEAAVSISEQEGAEVTLCYRGDAFSRAKPANRARVEKASEKGALDVFLSTSPEKLEPKTVHLTTPMGVKEIPNDSVIVCIGGELPTQFLRDSGIGIEVRHGE